MIIPVNDPADPRIDAYARLTDLQLRNRLEPSKGIFIAEGQKVIELAAERGFEPLSLLMEEKWLDSMAPAIQQALLTNPGLPIYIAPRPILKTLTGYDVTRGALGAFRRKPPISLDRLLSQVRTLGVLIGITNAMNVGAIFRNGAALGVDGLIVDSTCVDPLYRRALRSGMGCALTLPWTRFSRMRGDDETDRLFQQMADRGFRTIALALTPDSIALQDFARQSGDVGKLALFFGTEGTGLPPSILDRCDVRVRIPMARSIDSLNVASASAIAFWTLLPPLL